MIVKTAIRLILTLGICLLTVSCYKEMDPFTGDIGVRANINGEKFLCLTGEKKTPSAVLDGNTFSMEEELSTTGAWERFWVIRYRSYFILSINLQEEVPLETDADYRIGTGNNSASLRRVSGDKDIIPLQGWIRFLSIGSQVEARFELESAEGDYKVRHGFCRLEKR